MITQNCNLKINPPKSVTSKHSTANITNMSHFTTETTYFPIPIHGRNTIDNSMAPCIPVYFESMGTC